jgi:hypothetical protein
MKTNRRPNLPQIMNWNKGSIKKSSKNTKKKHKLPKHKQNNPKLKTIHDKKIMKTRKPLKRNIL